MGIGVGSRECLGQSRGIVAARHRVQRLVKLRELGTKLGSIASCLPTSNVASHAKFAEDYTNRRDSLHKLSPLMEEEGPDSGLGSITLELPACDGNQEEFGKSRLLNRKGGIATGQDKQTPFLNIFTPPSRISWTYPITPFHPSSHSHDQHIHKTKIVTHFTSF